MPQLSEAQMSAAMFDAAMSVLEQCDLRDEMFKLAMAKMNERGSHPVMSRLAVNTLVGTFNKVHNTDFKQY
ncbi:MAG: hypothetical protein Q4P13_08060 [Psychrobacter sp.]|nr:hypothetical protein [Psychrobacter sp.]